MGRELQILGLGEPRSPTVYINALNTELGKLKIGRAQKLNITTNVVLHELGHSLSSARSWLNFFDHTSSGLMVPGPDVDLKKWGAGIDSYSEDSIQRMEGNLW